MAEISITATGERQFDVQVIITTRHVVTVPAGLLEDLGLAEADSEAVVRESFRFLLEREPAQEILDEFSLDDISRYYPQYRAKLRRALGG
jgi:bifunctional DNA-binding transcriptional regulator/antitoxin component of YhaV-PrlF toxin-antitoxin module